MASRNFIAFDLGAESGRAVLGTLDGGHLALAETHRFANPNGRMNGHLHWDLLAQWEQLKTGLRKTAGGGTRIDGIGVDTWGVDFGLIGRGGEILGYPYMYRDSRTDGVMDKAFARVSREKIFDATGIQFMQFNSLYQLMAMNESNRALLDSAETLLFMPDLFNYLFTGIRKSEFSIATTSQMYDPRQRRWAGQILDALDLPGRILPEVVPSGTVLGPLRDDVASECGVGAIHVIAPATHDTGSAVAAVPASGDDWCYISSGTWSLMGVELAEPVINEKSLRYNYTNEGGVGGTIRFLKNIMGLWLVQECRREFERQGQRFDYAELTRLAEASRPHVAIIDPDHKPFLSPGEMPQKIHQYLIETRQPTVSQPGEFVRVCLESLAHTYRRTLHALEDILARKLNIIHIVGGGSQNELLNQMTADACGRTVIAGPVEGTAIGNILVQAMASKEVKSLSDARQIVRESFPVKRYEPRDTGAWDAAHARARSLMKNA
jgi:sugar (pentulose or hexulose) kinase